MLPVTAFEDARHRRSRWVDQVRGQLRPFLRPVGLFLASRVVVLVAVGTVIELGGGAFLPHRFDSVDWPTLPVGHLLPRALGSWDGAWYLLIATHGYFTTSTAHPTQNLQIAFFPVWPLVLHAGTRVTGINILDIGAAAALVIGCAAAAALWALVRELCDDEVADRAVALWAFFPGAYVLSMIYAEGLTMLCMAVCLLALLRRRWVVAGVAAGVGTGVQPDALVLVACCAWMAGLAVWRRRDWLAPVAPVLSLGGVVGYFAYLWARTGSPFEWYHVEKTGWRSGGGFSNNLDNLVRLAFERPSDLEALVPAIGLAWMIVGLVLMVRWRPPVVVWVFAVGVLLAGLASNPVGTRPRLLLMVFPLMVAVVRVVRRSGFSAVLGGSALLLGVLTIITLSQPLLPP